MGAPRPALACDEMARRACFHVASDAKSNGHRPTETPVRVPDVVLLFARNGQSTIANRRRRTIIENFYSEVDRP
jgi:hypothetical protein